MGDVDQPHDAERHRQPDGEQSVEAAEQAALDDDIDPIHPGKPYSPKYAAVMAARSKSLVGAVKAMRPSWKQ